MTTILGLDLGQFKSLACLYDPDTQETHYSIVGWAPPTTC